MYHIAVLTSSETQEAFYIEQLSRFCFERGLFPKMDCYRGQELFFDVARVNAPTCTVIALPGVEGLNAVEHLRQLRLARALVCGAAGEDAVEPLPADDRDPVTMLVVPSAIEIQHTASLPESTFLRGLQEGKLLGGRTKVGRDGKPGPVLFPPKEADPATGLELDEFVELVDRGTVTTFAIINIPFAGQRIKPPYVAAYVLLDGADIPFLHLVTEIDAADVRMGMRVEAVWKPREEWGLGIDNISHFKPSGEPDADYDSYKHHL